MESEEKKELEENKQKFESEIFKDFKEKFDQEKEIEAKLEKALEFMRGILSDLEKGNLRDFWDIKKLIGPLFKEKINPIKRNHLWSQYTELGDEAQRLKEINDEQAAFAVEQLEIAIGALEDDLTKYETLIQGIPHFNFPKGLKKLSLNEREYHKVQQELYLLKTLVSRLDALRREILAIDMRISHKNKILKRLSKLGDEIFPKRKELIKQISENFVKDVEAFAESRFSQGEGEYKAPYFAIRDEIKNLQSLAKHLTLNTQSFNKTRSILSACWEKIKEKEKEYRESMGERLEEEKKNYEEFLPKIEEFEKFCEREENRNRSKVLEVSGALQEEMRKAPLSRDHIKEFKERIQKARSSVLDQIEEKVKEKKQAALKEIEELKEKLENLIHKEKEASLDDLQKEEDVLQVAYGKLNLSQMDIHLIERQFADLKSFILNKKEEGSSKEDLESLYDERATHLEVIKSQMEEYRKEMGTSNLDFEKAMTYRELYDSAKIHYDTEVEALENLEEKLI